jgi:hypothetical protein
MGIDRRFGSDRRQYIDRRFGNSLNHYKGPERRGTFDRRSYNDRRKVKYESSEIDLFKNVV